MLLFLNMQSETTYSIPRNARGLQVALSLLIKNGSQKESLKNQAYWDGNRKMYESLSKQILVESRHCKNSKKFLNLGASATNQVGHTQHLHNLARKKILNNESSEYIVWTHKPANPHLTYNYLANYFQFIEYANPIIEKIVYIASDLNFYTFDESICSRYELHNSVELLWNERFPGSALLSLSDQDREHGYSTFRQFGLQPSDWFVTLHMRENSKYDESRNADVNSYIDAIQAVLDNGGWVIRLGSSDVSDLEFKHDRFIDYAKLGLRTDRLDVFLWAENRFMIGTSSGPLEIPPLFGKPVLWTNATAFGVNYFHRNSLVMPKLLISAENHNFRQLLEQGAYDVDHIPTRFKNVIHRDNTSDEIEMGVIEMIEGKTMIENEAQQSISDMLQIRGVYPTTTVSPYFARKHKEYFAL